VLTGAVGVFSRALFPFYAPALLYFGISFTGYHPEGPLRHVTSAAVMLAAAIATVQLLYDGPSLAVFQGLQLAIGASLATTVLVTTALGVQVARSQSPLALRRRGRLLAKTSLVAFFVPSLSLIIPNIPGDWVLVIGLLVTFPMAMAYAVVRHGVFNLRVVLAQGLVYALLSVGTLLCYLALVLLAFELAEQSAQALALSASFVALFVVALSLVQLRVQGAINRFVFRSRYLFSEAIAQASAKLASAKTRANVTEVVDAALIGHLQLSRAALAIVSGRELECISLGPNPAQKLEGEDIQALPKRLAMSLFPPLRRALATQSIVTAYDSAAASAQVAQMDRSSSSSGVIGCDEGAFWQGFGLEAVVPLTVGATAAARGRVIGLLLLGPKIDGKSLDSADEHLIFTLANQLAVALENAAAFDEIHSLKDGLEQQVRERTRDLSNALEDLKRAQVQLVESEKQAMLGRLVAGMAHEINSPLGTLRSSLDTLGRVVGNYRRFVQAQCEAGDPEGARLMKSSAAVDDLLLVMTTSANRLNELMGSLKRFVSLDQATHQRLDVRESIDSALAVLGPSLTPDITIRQNYLDSDLRIKGDPAKLNQLFWNLLQNSLTALKGKGEIRIDARRDDGEIQVDLSDNGVGIPEDRLHDVFDFGFTLKNGRVGLRLGLPTSKLTVDELGGEISIESVPGEGTSVHLRLPA
jgi:signal transduction histidine kinase